MVVAVKKIYEETQLDDDQFRKEVTTILRWKHKNIVKLIGYCTEKSLRFGPHEIIEAGYGIPEVRNMLLCYVYTNNKSLDNYIFSSMLIFSRFEF